MEAWIILLAIIWLTQYVRGKVWLNRPFIRAWPVILCLALTFLWVELQVAALPAGVLGLLSPHSLEIHTSTQTDLTLSLNVHATRESALKTLCYLLLFCLTLLLVNDKQRLKTLALVVVFSGVFQATYGALMTLSGLEYGFFIEKEHYRDVATGTFVNRNHLAGYLTMCLAMGIGLMLAELTGSRAFYWRDSARRLLRTLLGSKMRVRLALVVMVIGLVLTHSRMGNTAFFASLTIVGGGYFVLVRRITRNSIIFFASLLIIDLLVVGNFFGIDKVADRLQQTSVETEKRDELVQDSLKIVWDYPLTGTGAGSFYSTYPMYDTGEVGFAFYKHAHNDYLEFASEFGLVALALLGFSVLASLWVAIKAQLTRRDRLMQGMGFAVTMAICAVLIHSSVDFNLQIPANAALFIVIMAIGWVCLYWDPLAHRSRRQLSGASRKSPEKRDTLK